MNWKRVPLLVFLASVVLMTSCKDDEGNPAEKEVDITDPAAITTAIEVSSATLIAGSLPAPSSDPLAPVLSDYGADLTILQGKELIIDADVSSGSAIGFYLQVQGSDSYFDIASIKPTIGGRTEEVAYMVIQIPGNIKPGNFCVSYCVYDAEDRVSNVISRCITVKKLGGDGAAFLTGHDWQMVWEERYENNQLIEVDTVGKLYTDTYFTSIPCGEGYTEGEVQEEEKTNYFYLSIADNGSFSFSDSRYEKYYNGQGDPNCGPLYDEETDTKLQEGAWSYDATTHKLVIVFNEHDDDNESGEAYTQAIELTVSEDGDYLKLTSEDTDDQITEKNVSVFITKP